MSSASMALALLLLSGSLGAARRLAAAGGREAGGPSWRRAARWSATTAPAAA